MSHLTYQTANRHINLLLLRLLLFSVPIKGETINLVISTGEETC